MVKSSANKTETIADLQRVDEASDFVYQPHAVKEAPATYALDSRGISSARPAAGAATHTSLVACQVGKSHEEAPHEGDDDDRSCLIISGNSDDNAW